jgi:putative MATE family efflux protein
MQQNNNVSKLVDKSIPRTIIGMAIPMLAGTFAMTMYQLTNAWFVSRLGTEALAAISFTFPVVMFLMLLIRGLGSGAIPLVAHAIGERDHKKAAMFATHALILGIPFAIVISALGIVTITPLFSRLGASGEVLNLTARYMKIWYSGAVIVVLQMVITDIIISTGNTKAVSLILVSSTFLNALLDMVLIFGMFAMPKMGIAGAALATILSHTAALAVAFHILVRRLKLIDMRVSTTASLLDSWGKFLRFGIPGSLGQVINPIASAVITKLAAGYGTAAVAAMGVAGRIEMFSLMIPMTVGIPLVPFIAQNYGARRVDRIRKARKGTMIFAALYGIFIALLLIIFARPMARLFSAETAVIDILCTYIYITSVGYGIAEVHRYAGFTMIGTHKPFRASALNILRVVVLLIPLTVMGSHFFKLEGIFWGRLTTDLLTGLIGIWWSGKMLSSKYEQATVH